MGSNPTLSAPLAKRDLGRAPSFPDATYNVGVRISVRVLLSVLVLSLAGTGCKPKVVDPVGTWSTPVGAEGLVVTLNRDGSYKMSGEAGGQEMGGRWSVSGSTVDLEVTNVDGKRVNQDLNAPPRVTEKDIKAAHGAPVLPSKTVYAGMLMQLSPDGKTLTWSSYGMSVTFTKSGSK